MSKKKHKKRKNADQHNKRRNLTNTKKKVIKLMLMSLVGGMPLGAKASGGKPKSKSKEKKNLVATTNKTHKSFTYFDPAKAMYDNLNDRDLNYSAFKLAYDGWKKIKQEHPDIKSDVFTVIDFSLPSDRERFFVIDANKQEVIHKSVVAHGKNSGLKVANKFSNVRNSNMSSLGFYLTGETYHGKHGLSIRLDGLEDGINHNARKRAVVIHNADYASPDFVKKYGRLGRSFGCPALPKENYQKVVDWIKNKTVLFIYHPSENYFSNSEYGKNFLGSI